MLSFHIDPEKDRIRFGIHDEDHWVAITILYKEVKKLDLLSFLNLLSAKVESTKLTVEDLIRQKEEGQR